MKMFNIGNHNLGLRLVIRNLAESRKELVRRYIRLTFNLFGYSLTCEFRFRNSI